MRVAIVAEYYPRAANPVLGIWAHRQALAARAAGADVRVIVLHRPLPPLAALRRVARARGGDGARATALADLRQPARAVLDGIPVRYVRYVSPPRQLGYGAWGRWAAPALALALRALRREFRFDLVHAHYAVPAGDAVLRALPRAPLVVSVHGGDLLWAPVARGGAWRPAVTAALAHPRLVLANSAGMARRARELGAREVRVVHLGADIPAEPAAAPVAPAIVSVGDLVARKRHADVVRALARLSGRHPGLRYRVVGDGPERARLLGLARALGVADRLELLGRRPHAHAVAAAQGATLFVLPSVDEAFGVAYVEAMAAGVPAIGCRGEDGPEEIAASGGGIELVARGDVAALAAVIDGLLGDPDRRAALSVRARANVARNYTWERCGAATLACYEAALGRNFRPGCGV